MRKAGGAEAKHVFLQRRQNFTETDFAQITQGVCSKERKLDSLRALEQSFSLSLLSLLGLHLRNKELPRPGVGLELQLPAYATWDLSCIRNLHHSSWQHQILNPLSGARDEPTSSWILIGSLPLSHNGNPKGAIIFLKTNYFHLLKPPKSRVCVS